MVNSTQDRQEKRAKEVERAKKIVASYSPSPCNCEHCNIHRHVRSDFRKLAQELNDENGMSEVDLWITWRNLQKEKGKW